MQRVPVAYSVNDVVLIVIHQAKQVNTQFTIKTTLRMHDMNLILDKISRLDNFYTAIHTSYVMYGDTVTQIEFTFIYIDAFAIIQVCKRQASENKLTSKQRQIYHKAKAIITQIIQRNMIDYHKELVINNYLVKTCEYDKEAFNSGNQSDPRYIDAYTPYGVLFKGKAVCDGIAQTAAIMFTLAGLEGYILRSETHAWNLVRVGGYYYHLDVTWNKTTNSSEFFNLTDAQIIKYDKHNWNNKHFYPSAVATQYHYYVYNNLVVRNMSELRQQVKKDIDAKKKTTHVWVSGFNVTAADISSIMTGLNKSGYSVGSFSYKLPSKTPQDYSETILITY